MSRQIEQILAEKDSILGEVIEKINLPKIESTQNVFHDLLSCIIEQQIHYRSTKNTFQKILNASSLDLLTVNNFSVLEKKGFQNLKLSTRKYETIVNVLEFFQQNNIDWKSNNDNDIRSLLSQIKGVGVWTIEMILLYTLERPDIFPADDYHLKQIMPKVYHIDTSSRVKTQMKNIAKNWEPNKSMAVRYLFAWKKQKVKK